MEFKTLAFLLVVMFDVVKLQRNTNCITPNLENALCIPLPDCTVIYEAVQTNNSTALTFAAKSQCGYDDQPLVCCGTSAYSKPVDVFSIFTKPPATTVSPKQEKDNIILSQFHTKDLPDRTVCGFEKEANRVIGGVVTDLDEFPWMAALEFKSKYTGENGGIRCGGSVINNRYVLTAAHCIIDQEFELVSVWLGEWRISTDPDCVTLIANSECSDPVQKIEIEEQIPHPYYSKQSGNNDIGLLKLVRDIKYSTSIRPICMPPDNLPFPQLQELLTVVGWGATENGTESDIKLKVSVPFLTNKACQGKLSGRPIGPNQLCAGGVTGKDSCRGDSGGPLMRMYEDGQSQQMQWYQEGVVSWGVGCGRSGYPAIYTRVNRYVGWIINQINESGQ